MNILLFSFLFFLPAGVANMTPVIVAKLPIFREYCYPLDFNKHFRGRRVLGDHKTIRGFLSGIFVGIITAIILVNLDNSIYQNINPALIGFFLSFGALFGDSIKSFSKRQMGIASGKSWFPFDQIDYILGGLVLSLLFIRLSIIDYIVIFFLYFFLHVATSAVGFLLKFKNIPI